MAEYTIFFARSARKELAALPASVSKSAPEDRGIIREPTSVRMQKIESV